MWAEGVSTISTVAPGESMGSSVNMSLLLVVMTTACVGSSGRGVSAYSA